MLGVSPYKTRQQLIEEKAIGKQEEHNGATLRLFDRGHAAEQAARTVVEKEYEIDLFPVVGTSDELLASFDGITMDYEIVWEHKLWNEKHEMQPFHACQVLQQMVVSGAKRAIFTFSDEAHEPESTMYSLDDVIRIAGFNSQDILEGWNRFKQDVLEYHEIEKKGDAMSLPAITQSDMEMVAVINYDNFEMVKASVEIYLDAAVKAPKTADDYAQAENVIKLCKLAEVEYRNKFVDSLPADLAEHISKWQGLADMMRTRRLALEKAVKAEKERIKEQIISEYCDKWEKARLAQDLPVDFYPDFAGAMAGKKSTSGCYQGCDALLSAEIAAKAVMTKNEILERLYKNLESNPYASRLLKTLVNRYEA